MAGSETRFAVLLFTDIVGSTDLKARHGVPAFRDALRTHNDHFEHLAREGRGIRILQNMGDGYFAEGDSVAEVVKFALRFQEAMREGPWGEVPLSTRVGIHAGEISAIPGEGGSGIVAPAADLAARVMSLAMGGQILLTRFPFDEARHFIREHLPIAGKTMPPLRWLAHGPYLLKGRDEPMDIFEVGAEGLAPLTAPPDGEKAKRAIRPGEEETLGWRPAVGLEIPGRAGWQLTERLGAGGFGEVWTGEHAKLHQRRAFKFCFDDERLRALKREVTLVRLLRSALGERDDIVHIHELKLDAPPFYLESDLAPHGNLLQWAESQGGLDKIPLAQRIALVAHTATALAAAHSIGVLHKDIKPTNILIFDGPGGEPRPRLVDFGIGTLVDPAVLGEHGVTAAGFTRTKVEHSTGTPTYSPPEYLAGKPYTIQGDIYGLGILLYQLITVKPLEPLAQGWERDIPDPLLREDIAACVDGDPARRLPSAADLAERLLHLDRRRAEIVEKERLARDAAALAEAEAAARAAEKEAERQHKIAGLERAWKEEAQKAVVESSVATARFRRLLQAAARSDRLTAEENLARGLQREAFAYLARACDYDPDSMLAALKATLELNTWRYPPPIAILCGHSKRLHSVQFSQDGQRVVTASEDHTACVWDVQSGRLLATLSGHRLPVWSAQFSPDGQCVVTASWDRTGGVWDVCSGQLLATLTGHNASVDSASYSPDGHYIVTTSEDESARIWEAQTGTLLVTLWEHVGPVKRAQFSPDGLRVVTASEDRTARIWDARSGELLTTLSGHAKLVYGAQFSLDGRRVVTASEDSTACVWNAENGNLLATISGHQMAVWRAQFSQDGQRVVTIAGDGTTCVWDAQNGKLLTKHKGSLQSQFNSNRELILTEFSDNTACLCEANSGMVIASFSGGNSDIRVMAFCPDGQRVVIGFGDNSARVWDARNELFLVTPYRNANRVSDALFSPDGKRVAFVSGDNVCVWEIQTDTRVILSSPEIALAKARFSPDGQRIITVSRNTTSRVSLGGAEVWEIHSGKLLFILSEVQSAEFSPDNLSIVTTSFDNVARVRDAQSGELLVTLSGHEDRLHDARFSPDSLRIVTASADCTARIWDTQSGKPLVSISSHHLDVLEAQFSPDGQRIVTVSRDKTACVSDAQSGKPIFGVSGGKFLLKDGNFSPNSQSIVVLKNEVALLWDAPNKKWITLTGHGERESMTCARFSPDGAYVVTASHDGTAILWDAANGKLLARLVGNTGAMWCARFSPEGERIITASENGAVCIWTILTKSAGPPPEWFPDFLRYMAQMRLNSDGELETLKPDDWLALREWMRAVRRAGTGQDTPYLRILRRFVPE